MSGMQGTRWTQKRQRKLSTIDLQDILKRFSKGESLRSLAKEYGVTHQAISKRLWPKGRNGDHEEAVQEALPQYQPVGIPTTSTVTGDAVRGAYMLLVGKAHRGKIQECIDDLIDFLQHAEPLPPRERR